MKVRTLELIEENIREIALTLSAGKIALMPASTIYGISAVVSDKDAIERIYRIKSRIEKKPFIILIPDTSELDALTAGIGRSAKKLIAEYWEKDEPEQVTFIFKKNPGLADYVTAGNPKIALRVEKDIFLRKIIKASGPIVSTSATVSGRGKDPKSIEEVPEEIRQSVDLIVESKKKLEGRASTIVDISKNKPLLIREGGVKLLDIQKKSY